jgi:NAD+ kinase
MCFWSRPLTVLNISLCSLRHQSLAINSNALKNGTTGNRRCAQSRSQVNYWGTLLVAETPKYQRIALLASDSERAQGAYQQLKESYDFAPYDDADAVVVLGGDGYMLAVLHSMLDAKRVIPAYGLNLGTVGFLMNSREEGADLFARVNAARGFAIPPLQMKATTQGGASCDWYAINEVSLLRETRQTAKIEVSVDDKVRLEELVCDGVLLSTPAGSTAYNLSANGPILPLDSKLLALTPISAFRPRFWRGAILPERSKIKFTIREPRKRPVLAVADQKELRDIAEVSISIARQSKLTLLFDPGHSLEERIVAEQFVV